MPRSPRFKVAAVIAAGGTGTRMASALPKQFLELAGKPILLRVVETIAELDDLLQIVVALPARHLRRAREILRACTWPVPVRCVAGGATRQDSVRRAVSFTSAEADVILVHDAVRPLCDRETMKRVLDAAWKEGGAVPALPATETIQRVSGRGRVLATPPRGQLFAIQTPQCFHASVLKAALERARKSAFLGTDESSVVRWSGHPVAVVPGSPSNIKITRPIDLRVAEMLLTQPGPAKPGSETESMIRIGQGIDYHRLAEGRKLILGGVEIPFEKGLEGHSDADVLSHAVCDAVLGAAGLGDIGQHFPDTDEANRNRSSLQFLSEARRRAAGAGWAISNVDATLLAQRPRLSPYMEAMRQNVAGALGLTPGSVNIKATTTEGMNAEGQGEGISAQAVALLMRP
jgi:2-C-methyl-D-erythritol 4-phosphate cytidylyltransferase/2-C-methyl-D-erythritol 2,4-cyclodiphosphate synthase